jgi:hypothetical protein
MSKQISRSIRSNSQRRVRKRKVMASRQRWQTRDRATASSAVGWSKRIRKARPSGASPSLTSTSRYLMFVSPFPPTLHSDPRLQPSENSPDSRNQPSPIHSQMLGDKQSAKFAVHLPRAGRNRERVGPSQWKIKRRNSGAVREEEKKASEESKFNCGRLLPVFACRFLYLFSLRSARLRLARVSSPFFSSFRFALLRLFSNRKLNLLKVIRRRFHPRFQSSMSEAQPVPDIRAIQRKNGKIII